MDIQPKYVNIDAVNEDIAELEQQIESSAQSINDRVANFRAELETEANAANEVATRELSNLKALRELVTPAPVIVEEETVEV